MYVYILYNFIVKLRKKLYHVAFSPKISLVGLPKVKYALNSFGFSAPCCMLSIVSHSADRGQPTRDCQ